jgi:MFS family permease
MTDDSQRLKAVKTLPSAIDLRAVDQQGNALPANPSSEIEDVGNSAQSDRGEGWPPILRALNNHDFRIFWSGNFLSNVGTWMQNVAQGWLVLQLTNSAFWLGMVGFAASMPFLIFTLFGGVIADRVNKRMLLIVTQTAQMIFAFTLAGLAYFKVITITQVAVLCFLNGVALALNAPSYQALVPLLVRRDDLPNAIALNSAQFNMSRILGPTLGGYAMAWVGVAGNFFLNGVSFLAVLVSLFRIRYPDERRFKGVSMWQSLREGIAYVRRDAQMAVVVALIASASLLLLPFLTFVPYFAKNVLNAGERGLGLLMACSGLGAFLAAASLAHLGRVRHRGKVIVTSGLFVMSGVIIFCYSHSFVLSCAMSFCEGFGMIFSISTVNITMQQLSSDEMRGRVMSIYATSFLGLPPIGCLITGELSRHMPTPHAIALMTSLGIVSYLVFYARSKSLRELD